MIPPSPLPPMQPITDPSFRWAFLILTVAIVAVSTWFVISHGILITPEESSPVPVVVIPSPTPVPIIPIGDALDQETNNHVPTLNTGTDISDIDQDINATDINASDRELRALEEEMKVL